jgi:hypothetical protein
VHRSQHSNSPTNDSQHARVLLDSVGCQWVVRQEERKTSVIAFDRANATVVHTERWLVFTSELGAVHRLHDEADASDVADRAGPMARSDTDLRSLLERSLRASPRL